MTVMARICLIPCVSMKAGSKKKASELYLSPLFKGAKEFAINNSDRWYILSAKYGLVSPKSNVEPYDATLNKMTTEKKRNWAKRVYKSLMRCTQPDDEIIFLAGANYRKDLIPLLVDRGNRVLTPMEGLSIGKQLKWLKQQNNHIDRRKHLEEFYSLLRKLENIFGGKRVLSECHGRMKWPERGVYFFFEPYENRSLESNQMRVVRVGTHMVSKGSKASFWHRLHTHRGTEDGRGNHRGSIFRLHVGEAIIRRSNDEIPVPTWGIGQSASEEVRKKEVWLEKEVSKYLGKTLLLWLEVPDNPGPDSDRAYIERNSIGLLSGSGNPLDIPSKTWLGNFSSCDPIRKSGLWNVNHVVYGYDYRFLDVLRYYIECAAGTRPLPKKSIAPEDWYLADKGKDSKGQMFLFSEV